MAEGHKAKSSKKGRKHGRNKRKPGASRQAVRTEANKVKTFNRQRKLAGLPPVGPATARILMDKSLLQQKGVE